MHNSDNLNLVLDIMNNNDLSWKVEKENLLRPNGTPTETWGLFRSDNGFQLNRGVAENYTVYQNWNMIADLVEVVGDYLQLDNVDKVIANEIQGGRKIALHFPVEEMHINHKSSDVLKRYITITNSHDGSSSIAFGSTNETVSCSNMFHKANKQLSKVRHTKNMKVSLDTLKMEMKNTIEMEKVMTEEILSLIGQDVNPHIITEVKDVIVNPQKLKYDELPTQRKNIIDDLNKDLIREIEEKGHDAFGLFNGVTRFNTHTARTKDRAKHIYSGSGYKTNNMVLDILLNEAK